MFDHKRINATLRQTGGSNKTPAYPSSVAELLRRVDAKATAGCPPQYGGQKKRRKNNLPALHLIAAPVP